MGDKMRVVRAKSKVGVIIVVLCMVVSTVAIGSDSITIETGSVKPSPAIWGKYVVWKGAENEVYDMADTITLDITAFNPSSEPMTISSSGSWMYESYRIDGTFDPYSFEMAMPSVRHMTIAPNASYTWTRKIPIQDHYWYTFTPGTHSITGVLISYAESDMIEFEIVE